MGSIFSLNIVLPAFPGTEQNSEFPKFLVLVPILFCILGCWLCIKRFPKTYHRNAWSPPATLMVIFITIFLISIQYCEAGGSSYSFHSAKSRLSSRSLLSHSQRFQSLSKKFGAGIAGIITSTASMLGITALAEFLFEDPTLEQEFCLTLAIFLIPIVILALLIYALHNYILYRRGQQTKMLNNKLKTNPEAAHPKPLLPNDEELLNRLTDLVELNIRRPSHSRQ